ncbi:hypothetical protein, variant 2 [Phialophora macrospora]|uniref:Uncharacterized protein n=1 Tax=Phialophora macrospora TaxID=1851006 RepID=A0A0D2FVI6_9EURO|nr:hypothetical protein PV04_02759 [Phialophora macrospora]KIW70496.1 hypothetical protein, variant 1 [Phialophora macrospora]KIW70497.1 hypothetical protein, variant 2 [Phialophora macrospora]
MSGGPNWVRSGQSMQVLWSHNERRRTSLQAQPLFVHTSWRVGFRNPAIEKGEGWKQHDGSEYRFRLADARIPARMVKSRPRMQANLIFVSLRYDQPYERRIESLATANPGLARLYRVQGCSPRQNCAIPQ